MSATPRFSYVGEVKHRSLFPLLCCNCDRPIESDNPAFVYFDNGPAVFVVFDSLCSIALDEKGHTNYTSPFLGPKVKEPVKICAHSGCTFSPGAGVSHGTTCPNR
jgi:hypothetical protein